MVEQLRIWAGVQGFVSAAGVLSLLLYFVLATPFAGERRQWAWLGPTNDWLAVIGAVPWIVATLLLAARARAGTGMWVFTAAVAVGIAAIAGATLLMLAGRVPLGVQAIVGLAATLLAFCWAAAVAPAVVGAAGLPRWVAIMALWMLIALVAGGASAGIALVVPDGPVRLALFVAAAAAGGSAWIAYPAWWFAVASTAR